MRVNVAMARDVDVASLPEFSPEKRAIRSVLSKHDFLNNRSESCGSVHACDRLSTRKFCSSYPRGGPHSNPRFTQIRRILDSESKSEAVVILSDGISSIPVSSIQSCVFSTSERCRFHTWGLFARDDHGTVLLSVVVFRRHVRLGLIELSLIATERNSRRGGFASELLGNLRKMWTDEGFSYIMTFADPSAFPFFVSKGFSSAIPYPRDLYDCWIDKYSHSLLMCLCLHGAPQPISQAFSTEAVEVLVFMDNCDKRPTEVWVQAVAFECDEDKVLVVYSYQLRNYQEWLAEDSIRIRLPVR
jgi:hypothetical protein